MATATLNGAVESGVSAGTDIANGILAASIPAVEAVESKTVEVGAM